MKARKWGRIINIASAHGLVASPFKVAYVAAKHGIAGLTKTVALEAANDGITVQRDLPGLGAGRRWSRSRSPTRAKARGMTERAGRSTTCCSPSSRPSEFVTVERSARSRCFSAGDAAATITGSTCSIDGGWTAQ